MYSVFCGIERERTNKSPLACNTFAADTDIVTHQCVRVSLSIRMIPLKSYRLFILRSTDLLKGAEGLVFDTPENAVIPEAVRPSVSI